MNIWDEDVKLEINEAKRLIEEQFKPLKVEEISFIANGFDNSIYKVNHRYMFRFPRRKIANKLIQTESGILPILKQHLSFPLPNPVFYGNPTSYYPYNFLGCDYLNGFGVEEIKEINGTKSLPVLADFLSRLHSISVNEVKSIVGNDGLDRCNVVKRKNTLMKNVEAIKNIGIYETSKLETYISNLTDIKLDDEKVLVHGDLHIRNLLYDTDGTVSAVIDFGDVHIGHKAIDLSIIYSIIQKEFRNDFFEIYGKVSQETLDFAKFKSVYVNSFIILHAHDLGNTSLLKKAIKSIDNALS